MFWLVLKIFAGCILLESGEIDFSAVEAENEEIEQVCTDEPNCLDLDGDGYPKEEDCDDEDENAIGIEQDLDCDGISNALDPCPLDPFNDLDQDGLCGDQDSECNLDFALQQWNLEQELHAISSCSSVEGDIYIYDISSEILPTFESLEVLKGSIFIGNNKELHTIDAFPALVTMLGVLRIQDNPKLEILSGFDKLSDIQGIEIFNHPNLCESEITKLIEKLNYPSSEQAGNNSDC